MTMFDFDSWLAGAGLPQSSVEILQRPELLARLADMERRARRLSADRGIADDDVVGDVAALLAEVEASRTVWFVRALTSEDVDAILAAHPIDPTPRFTGRLPAVVPNPTEAQARAFLGMWESYEAQRERWQAEHAADLEAHAARSVEAMRARGAERISRAVVRIEQQGQVIADHVTVVQAMALPRVLGEPQVAAILAAIDAASDSVPEVDPDFLSRISGGDQASSDG